MILNINDAPKKVHISENKIYLLRNSICEGVKFSPPSSTNPYIDTVIQPIKYPKVEKDGTITDDGSSKDRANSFGDTRVWGAAHDVLYGDKTLDRRADSLDDLASNRRRQISAYKIAIDAIRNGRRRHPNIPPTYCEKRTYDSIMSNLMDPYKSDEDVIDYFSNRIFEFQKELDLTSNKWDRAVKAVHGKGANPNEKIPRYDVGVVPGTDVKLIALFRFNDFNVSDAIKNGTLRQNQRTDSMLGITNPKTQREKNENLFGSGNTLKKLKTTYDNGTITPDIATNFSLKGIDINSENPYGSDHEKQQFKSRDAFSSDEGYDADTKEKYSSVTQFMDKSILAARYALKKEDVKIDYILPAPSSSNFNRYYCLNLSRKLGVPCKFDFFKRNILNVKLDDGIYNAGLPDMIIKNTEDTIRNAALNEISAELMDTVEEFVSENFSLLSKISLTKSSREKADFNQVCQFLKYYSYYGLCNIYEQQPKVSNLHMYLVNHFMDYTKIKKIKGYDSRHILTQLMNVIRTRLSKKYQKMLMTLDWQIWKYQDYLKDENGGWKLKSCKKFKITDIDKKARQFVRDAYVVSDNELDDKNHLYSRYNGANFLIVDEDMNSGGTLMLLINALKDKLVGHVNRTKKGPYGRIKSNQITCLVNSYSLKG